MKNIIISIQLYYLLLYVKKCGYIFTILKRSIKDEEDTLKCPSCENEI